MSIRVETEVLPAFLASALVNGDLSGLQCNCSKDWTPTELFAHERCCTDYRWLERVERFVCPGRVVSVEGESYFAHCLIVGERFSGDVAEYVIHYEEN